jgi:hypothetical protein
MDSLDASAVSIDGKEEDDGDDSNASSNRY